MPSENAAQGSNSSVIVVLSHESLSGCAISFFLVNNRDSVALQPCCVFSGRRGLHDGDPAKQATDIVTVAGHALELLCIYIAQIKTDGMPFTVPLTIALSGASL